jgi:hypothetical protein
VADHPRIERDDIASFTTIGTRNHELWFINNPKLDAAILGYLAKFSKRYDVKIYAFAIEGTHKHEAAFYPKANRADFQRDLNSCTAKAVQRENPDYPGGSVFARSYSSEWVPTASDIEERFWYTVLQPMKDGVAERVSEFLGYHCFHDAIWGVERKYEVIDWTRYNKARKRKLNVKIKDFTEIITFKYERLPGYEQLSQRAYAEMMKKRFEEKRRATVTERYASGKGYLGVQGQLRIKAGQRAKNPKTSARNHKRPRVSAKDPKVFRDTISWYFDMYFRYKEASRRYREGELDVEFPPGTYRPPVRYRPPPPPS